MKILEYKILIIFTAIFCLFILIPYQAISQEKKSVDKEILTQSVKSFLSDYVLYGELSEDGNVISSNYKYKFKNLFKRNAKIFNDIDPENKTERKLSISEYVLNIEKLYPNGLKIQIHKFKICKPFKINDQLYNAIILVEKEIFGFYKESRVYRQQLDLRFAVQFNLKNNTPENLMILSIERTNISKISIFFEATPAYTQFLIKEPDKLTDYSGWSNKGSFGYSCNVKLQYSLRPFLGIGAGLGFSSYNSKFSLTHLKQEDYYTTDRDSDNYYLRVEADNIHEKISYKCLNIPLFVRIDPFFSSHWNFVFLEAGVQFSIPLSASSDFSGSATHQGYYPQYHILLYDIPELGFYTDKDFNYTNSFKPQSTSVNGYVMLGCKFPFLNPSTSLNLGIMYIRGITTINDNNEGEFLFSKEYGDYNSLINASSDVKLQSFGFSIGVSIGLD